MPTDLPERFHASDLRIRHYGYLKARIEDRDKHARNLALLRGELERAPDDPFVHFNIGTEFVGLGDLARPARTSSALALLRRTPPGTRSATRRCSPPRLIGVRRTRRRPRRRRRAGRAARDLPGLHRPALRARPRGPRARRPGDGARALRALPRPRRRAAPASRAWPAAARSWRSPRWRSPASSGDRGGGRAAAPLAGGAPGLPGRGPRPGRDAARRPRRRPRRDARRARVVRARGAHLVALPRHRLLRARARRAGRGAFSARARDRPPARRRPRRPGRGAALAAPLRRGRAGARRAAAGTPASLAVARAACLRGRAARRRRGLRRGDRRARRRPSPEVDALQALQAAVLDGDPVALRPEAAEHVVRTLDALARLEEFEAFERAVPLLERALGDRRQAARRWASSTWAAASTRSRPRARWRRSPRTPMRARSRCSARAPWRRGCSRTPSRCSRPRSRSTRARPRCSRCSSGAAGRLAA